MDIPRIVFNGTASQYGTIYSATVAVESDYFMAVNVAFVVIHFLSFLLNGCYA
jgi:pectinesterase